MEQPPSPRTRSFAGLLPLLGVFLWMPPFILLFAGPARPWGVPLVLAYLFGVWAALLASAFLLARALRPRPGSGPEADADGAGPPGQPAPPLS